MVTETDRNKARSAVVSAYNALDCVTIPFSFLHAFADAAVDAVSTDAEPDGWICENDFTLEPDLAWEWEDKGLSPKPFYFSPQQNADPVKTAPAVAVKQLEWSGNIAHTPFGAYSIDESVQPDAEEAKALVQADFEARIRSALVECETYFEARADADCDQDGFMPNEEMRILVEVKEALSCRQLNSFFAGRSTPSKKETQEGVGDIVEELKDEAVRLSIEKGGETVSSRDVTGSIIFKGAREIERLRQLLSDAGNREQVANAVEQERLRFEGDLDKWMKIIGAGITGFQPEAYAVMDMACEELVRLRTALSEAEKRAKDAEGNLNEERAHREKLQAALMFWMPSVTEEIERSTNGRCGDDAGLLAGYDGPIDESCWGDEIIARVGGARREALEEAAILAGSIGDEQIRSGSLDLDASVDKIIVAIRALIPSEPHDAEGRE